VVDPSSTLSPPDTPRTGVRATLASIENGFTIAVLSAMVLLTIFGVCARWIAGESLAGITLWVQSLNLWIAFAGAVLAARAGSHLGLSTGALLALSERARDRISIFTGAVATAVTVMLAYASIQFVRAMTGSDEVLAGGLPIWVVQLGMPLGFALVAVRLSYVGRKGWAGIVVAVIASAVAASMGWIPDGDRGWLIWVGSIVLLASLVLGTPIFAVLGGLAMLLFFAKPLPVPISAVPLETYDITRDAQLVAIPMFTLAGYLLAEGGASGRLVRLFRTWVGWAPGGIAAAAILVCAFFTTFTGASGVTILALGGLLLPILLKAGYPERFSIGLLAGAGSIGLLFPPSLPVILYGATAKIPIDELYVAGVVPGLLLIGLLVAYGVIIGLKYKTGRDALDVKDAFTALWEAKWEVALPILVLTAYFTGLMTIFEAAAFTAAYAFFTEVVIHRDLKLKTDVPRVFVKCATLLGGVLIILGVAKGLTNYLVDAEVPMAVAAWVGDHVASKILFILLLNVFLLLVGCLMDIFSAIVVVVPLIIPLGLAFGVDPFHLGILFLANLELGYLTPPVGMNLFMASYRFERALTAVYRMALPFLGILALGVLLIAYVPGMTTWAHDESNDGPSVEELFAEAEAGAEGEPAATGEGGSGDAPPLLFDPADLEAMLAGDDDDDSADGDDDDSADDDDDDSADGDDDSAEEGAEADDDSAEEREGGPDVAP